MKPEEGLVCTMHAAKFVSVLTSSLKTNGTAHFAKNVASWPGISIYFSAVELLVLLCTLFFLPCLRKYATWVLSFASLTAGTMKKYLGFSEQVITRSPWGCVCQVSWNFFCEQAHVSNLGLGTSNPLQGFSYPPDVSTRPVVSLVAHCVGRVMPAGWVVPWKTAHLA